MITAARSAARSAAGRLRDVGGRAAPGPLAVRLGAFGSGLAALLLACPRPLLSPGAVAALVVLAAAAAAAPRSRWATGVVLAAAGGWLLGTSGQGHPVRLVPLVALAVLLYLAHSLTALAAVLPYDAVVPARDLWRWAGRAAAVAVAATTLGVLVVFAAGGGGAGDGGAALLAALAGLALALLLVALLTRLPRR